MNQLKPLSDMEKELLKALGEDPHKHQQEVLARMQGKKIFKEKEKKKDPLLQKLQEGTVNIIDSSPARIIEGWVEPVWIPEAYVLFIRHSTCRNCGAKTTCQDDSQIYLRSRSARKDSSNPKRYVPVKVMELPLKKHIETRVIASSACLSCFSTMKTSTTDSTKEPPISTSVGTIPPAQEKAYEQREDAGLSGSTSHPDQGSSTTSTPTPVPTAASDHPQTAAPYTQDPQNQDTSSLSPSAYHDALEKAFWRSFTEVK